jgi:hypothetical protein
MYGLRPPNGNAFVASVLVLLSAVLFAPAFVAAGSEFDEGILVTFPVRVLHGDLPYRDFETFYGPAQPFLTAGVFDVFGSTLGTERAISFCFRLLLVIGAYVVLLPFGRAAAFAGGFLAAIVLAAGGVTFDSEVAAQALGSVALTFAWQSLTSGSEKLLAGAGFSAASWSGESKSCRFPGPGRRSGADGASLGFGYLANIDDLARYAGSSFSYLGFDELTRIPEQLYLRMFRVLRQPSRATVSQQPTGRG